MITSTKGIVVVAVVGVLVVFGSAMYSPKSKNIVSQGSGEKQADRDTAADSLGTITAQTQETRSLVEKEQEARKLLGDEIKQEYKNINRTLEEAAAKARRATEENAIALAAEIKALKERLVETESELRRKPAVLPVTPKAKPVATPKPMKPVVKIPSNEYIWIRPIDQATVLRAEKNKGLIRSGGLLPRRSSTGTKDDGQTSAITPSGVLRNVQDKITGTTSYTAVNGTDKAAAASGVRKAYTIPENSTLIGAQAMTGLFGRIPVSGAITDPLPFRVITGVENLASQGFEIPNLEGAVWRGVASGDRTLRCVVGRLISVTFIFEDGTIRTVRGSTESPLGSLIDDRGYPCIPGTYITDAPRHIAGIAAVGAAVGAAGAIGDREVTRRSGYNGVTESVTGDTGKYILGNAAEEAFSEIATLLRDRMKESFDAVVVQPGAIVALAVDTEIRIDYEVDGRRIDHLDGPQQIGDVHWHQPVRREPAQPEKQYVWRTPSGDLPERQNAVVQHQKEGEPHAQ